MSNDLTLAARLTLDAQKWTRGLGAAQGGLRGFVSRTRADFRQLRGELSGITGQVAGIGVAFGTASTIMQSARMDKSLTQIGQTAGVSREEVAGLRGELFRLSAQTGQNVDDLQSGFETLIQSGLNWDESLSVIDATNKAMAVTGSQAEVLTGALGVVQTAFKFDLSKPGQALALLDKMTVAGRRGNAELEDLSGIISRVGVNASGAGFGFDKTLAFVEGLSMIERQPERLATLADSTLRLFTNDRYMKDSEAATGVAFFDKKGGRRDPLVILADIKKKYDALRTDAQRHKFLSNAFGQADLDTIKGLKTILNGGTLSGINALVSDIGGAGGSIERDLPTALANSVDQAGRLKTVLREAADGFAQPINDAVAGGVMKLVDSRENGGLGMSGGQVAGLGAAGVLSTILARRVGGRMVSGFLDRITGNTAAGVVKGKALEAAAGVTPVYVTNFAEIGGGGMGSTIGGGAVGATAARASAGLLPRLALAGGSSVGSLAGAGAAGLGAIAAGIAAAALAGGALGKIISETLLQRDGVLGSEYGAAYGEAVGLQMSKIMAFFGSEDARNAVDRAQRNGDEQRLKGELTFHILGDGRAQLVSQKTNQPGVRLTTNTGRMMSVPRAGHE